jgi:hypothetical protein
MQNEKNVKAGTAPKTLIDTRKEQISALIRIRPCEAVSVAKKLVGEYPDDDDALVLCLSTAAKAEMLGVTGSMSEELSGLAQKASERRFFNPDLLSLSVASKVLTGKALACDDMALLRRAYALDPRITNVTMRAVRDRLSGDERKAVEAIVGTEDVL